MTKVLYINIHDVIFDNLFACVGIQALTYLKIP